MYLLQVVSGTNRLIISLISLGVFGIIKSITGEVVPPRYYVQVLRVRIKKKKLFDLLRFLRQTCLISVTQKLLTFFQELLVPTLRLI